MCRNLPFEVKTNWHFTKWDGLNILFVIQHIRCFKIFWGSAMFFYKFLLKWGKMKKNVECNIFLEVQNYYFVFESRLIFFSNGHIHNVVWTLPNVVKIDVENENVASTLPNVVQFNVDIHNVVSTLIWCCATSRGHINLKTTLNRRWNFARHCHPRLPKPNLKILLVNWNISEKQLSQATSNHGCQIAS